MKRKQLSVRLGYYVFRFLEDTGVLDVSFRRNFKLRFQADDFRFGLNFQLYLVGVKLLVVLVLD